MHPVRSAQHRRAQSGAGAPVTGSRFQPGDASRASVHRSESGRRMRQEHVDLSLERTVSWAWAPTRLARAILESMYFWGELIVDHKVHTRKYYDYTTRHLRADRSASIKRLLESRKAIRIDIDGIAVRFYARLEPAVSKVSGLDWLNRPSVVPDQPTSARPSSPGPPRSPRTPTPPHDIRPPARHRDPSRFGCNRRNV